MGIRTAATDPKPALVTRAVRWFGMYSDTQERDIIAPNFVASIGGECIQNRGVSNGYTV